MKRLKLGVTMTERCSHDGEFRTGAIIYLDGEKYTVRFPKGYRECYFRDESKRGKSNEGKRAKRN